MNRLLLVAVLLTILVALGACAKQQPPEATTQVGALAELHTGLERADRVSIYFVKMTDEPNFTVPEFIKQAGVSVVRRCGANCANKMRAVLEHFRAAEPVKCRAGDQNVVILVDKLPPLIYSRGGHFIEFRNKCYFNQKSINDLLETSDFIFL